MKRIYSDRSNQPLTAEEATTLFINDPLSMMSGRRELHLSKPEAFALAKWLGFGLARPDLEAVPGPEAVAEPTP